MKEKEIVVNEFARTRSEYLGFDPRSLVDG